MSHIEVWLVFACVNVHFKKCIDADVFIAFRLEAQDFYMQKAKELKHIADKNVSWQRVHVQYTVVVDSLHVFDVPLV